jgi:hypothetical protein
MSVLMRRPVAAIILASLACLAFGTQPQAQNGAAERGRNRAADPLAPLVPGPWTGKIEVTRTVNENDPGKVKKEDYAMNWANMAPGGTSRLGTALYMTLKATALISAVAKDADVGTDVTGELEYQYRRRRTIDETQRISCRAPQRNPYIGMVSRTTTEEERTTVKDRAGKDRAGKDVPARISLDQPGDVSASVLWRDDAWRVRIFVKPKQFETVVEDRGETKVCESPPRPLKENRASYQTSDQLEFEVETGITDQLARSLAGGAPITQYGRRYVVSWTLARK